MHDAIHVSDSWLGRSMLALLALSPIVVVSASAQVESTAPPMPYEEVACPFEGCVYRDWKANTSVVARKARDTTSAPAFTIDKGQSVHAITGIVVTTVPGVVTFHAPADIVWAGAFENVELGGQRIHRPTEHGTLHVDAGDTLYTLTYHGEGEFSAWCKGRLYDDIDGSAFYNGVCEYDASRCKGEIVTPAQNIWWVQIRNARGEIGWTSETDKFDGKDALDRP